MSCKCAKQTDEWHGWECEITGGECMFLRPDSKACAEIYEEGPDAVHTDDLKSGIDLASSKKPVEEATSCAECVRLKEDHGTFRCMSFDGARIEDITEKHCKDSIYG